ncbi:hypothetical protein [uncultured Mucilaginibacter sp.]|uniref:DUF7674 family protein n=1 Tax=uncultured Mucilaginibacter sp. TaxID=797541 RepID=UPI0025E6CB98|nr:hypothetical protein [uncultured Mucilaginibacter sp.]
MSILPRQLEIELVDDLFLAIPQFKNYVKNCDFQYSEKVAYLLFDDLGRFVTELMLKNIDIEITYNCFNYINVLGERKNVDIDNLLGVTFIESLASIVELRTAAKAKLKGRTLTMFQDVVDGPMFNSKSRR